MARAKSDLLAQLDGSSEVTAVVLLSDLREAVGDKLAELRKYTAEQYRDGYLYADAFQGRPRKVRVHRRKLLDELAPKPSKPAEVQAQPEKESAKPTANNK